MSQKLDPSVTTAAWDRPEESPTADPTREPRSPSAAAAGVPLFSFGPWLWASFGVLLAGLLTLTGVGLLFFFEPSPGTSSLVDLEQATRFGFLRDVHFWAGQGLLIAAWLHLTRVFAAGSYRRRLGWRVTVSLVLLVTFEAWLGGVLSRAPNLSEQGSLLAAFAAHIVIVPAMIVGAVTLWKRRRSAVLVATAEESTGPEHEPASGVASSLGAASPLDGESQSAPEEPSEESSGAGEGGR